MSRLPVRSSTAIVLVLLVAGCGSAHRAAEVTTAGASSTVVLVSLDGFMPQYFESYDTPNLDRLSAEGVRAESLIPAFPTKTFPNHYTVVTGLYPANHGVVSNTMYDPEMDASFSLSNREAVIDGRWWGGEPLWVTVEKQGGTAATYFWPGSEAEIDGVRPTYWKPYEHEFPNEQRVDSVLAWLQLPPSERPDLVTVYFADVDSEGHYYGPWSDETRQAVAHVDSLIGRLIDGLETQNLLDFTNVIVVSDHGMAETSSERVVFLDDYLDPDLLRVVDWSPVLMANPRGIDAADAVAALDAAPHVSAYLKDELPERWHFSGHRRITEIVAVADEGWSMTTRANYDRNPNRYNGGTHGYDNALPSMQSIFVARGPTFRSGQVVESFANIHLYELMASILRVEPAPNDGSLDAVRHVLARSSVGVTQVN